MVTARAEVATPKEDAQHSGRLLLRLPPALHAELAQAAEHEVQSLNAYITQALLGVEIRRATSRRRRRARRSRFIRDRRDRRPRDWSRVADRHGGRADRRRLALGLITFSFIRMPEWIWQMIV